MPTMLTLPNPVLLALSVIAGIISHKLYWSRRELDAAVPQILLGAVLVHLALSLALAKEYTFAAANYYAILLEGIYVTSVFTSIVAYRLLFHPLKRYRGPYWARLTTWWKVKHIAEEGPHYALIDKIHGQYGEIVRIGPNNLSINNVEALQAIYGSQSSCTKPPSYLIGGLVSVQSERDPHRHRLRRAVWDRALASNTFLPRLNQLVDLLVFKLTEYDGKPVSVNDWMHFITFDVMAQFIFSRDWNQLATGTMNKGISYASAYLKFAIYGTQVPWLALSLMKIPYMPEPQSAMVEFAARALDDRMKQEPTTPDAMSHLLGNKDPEAQQFLSRHDLESDVFMIILAGADTSFSVLVNLCFRLAANPHYQIQLREEVAAAFSADEQGSITVNWPALSSCAFLTALINETLRLHPPVSSGMPRLTPPEGLIIPLGSKSSSDTASASDDNSIHIPGNIVISVPTYSIQRSTRYFVAPESFIPERWTTRPELVIDKRAWCPFSLGAYGCAGKYFALMEIKLVIARLVSAFDVQFVEQSVEGSRLQKKEDREAWLKAQDDHMTLQPAQLKLSFVSRAS